MSRHRFVYASLLGAALLVSGCIQTKDDTKVGKDGAGSFTEDFTIDMSAMKQIGEMMKGFGGGPGGEAPPGGPGMDAPAPAMGDDKKPDESIDKLKKHFEGIEGVELTKFEPWGKEGDEKMGVHLEATFKTLEGYAKASGLEMDSELKKNDDGSYTLSFEGDFTGEGKKKHDPAGDPAMGDTPPAMGEDPMAGMGEMMMGMMEPFMKNLEFTRKVSLPGSIVSTNGEKSEDGSAVTWKITWKDIKDKKAGAQTVTFKGEGLDLKPFKVHREHEAMGGPGGGKPGGGEFPGK